MKTIPKITTYNHAFDIAFSISNSKSAAGEDVTAEQMAEAIITRVKALLSSGEMLEAVGCSFDTYEEEELK